MSEGLKFVLSLDDKQFNEGIKRALGLLDVLAKSGEALGVFKRFNLAGAISEVDKLTRETSQLNKELQETQKESREADNTLNKMGSSMSSSGAGGMLSSFGSFGMVISGIQSGVQMLRGVVNGVKGVLDDLTSSAGASELAIAKLRNGLHNVGEGEDSLRRLNKQAQDLQKMTIYSDEDITQSQSMLTTFMKSSQEIEILTPRMLDLASAYKQGGDEQMSLQQVAVMLGKVNEDTIGALRRVGVAFSKEQEEKLKSLKGTEQAIYLSEILDSNFKGMAQTVGGTFTGQLKVLANAWDDVKEMAGGFITEALMPMLPGIKSLMADIGGLAEIVMTGAKSIYEMTIKAYGGAEGFGKIKDGIINFIREGLTKFFEIYTGYVLPAFLSFHKAIKDILTQNPELISSIKTVMGAFFAFSTGIMTGIIRALALLVNSINWVIGAFKTVIGWIGSFISMITKPIGALPFVQSIISGLGTVIDYAVSAIKWIGSLLGMVGQKPEVSGEPDSEMSSAVYKKKDLSLGDTKAPGSGSKNKADGNDELKKSELELLQIEMERAKIDKRWDIESMDAMQNKLLGLLAQTSDLEQIYQIKSAIISIDKEADDLGNKEYETYKKLAKLRADELKAQDERIEKLKKLQLQLDKLESSLRLSKMPEGLDKEIAKIKEKSQAEIKAFAESKEMDELNMSVKDELIAKYTELKKTEDDYAINALKNKKKLEQFNQVFDGLKTAFASFFDTITESGKSAGDGIKALFKSILNSILNFVQGLLLGAIAKSFLSGILSFGATLIQDLPMIALATAGIEGLRAFVGSFAGGGLISGSGSGTSDSNIARVSNGEFIVNASATRENLSLLRSINSGASPAFYSGASGSAGASPVYIGTEMDGFAFHKINAKKYEKYKNTLRM